MFYRFLNSEITGISDRDKYNRYFIVKSSAKLRYLDVPRYTYTNLFRSLFVTRVEIKHHPNLKKDYQFFIHKCRDNVLQKLNLLKQCNVM